MLKWCLADARVWNVVRQGLYRLFNVLVEGEQSTYRYP
jgi:hypothetical protein